MVRSDDAAIVTVATSALANTASEKSMPVMLPLLDDAGGKGRHHLVRYLGRVGTPVAVERLVAVLDRWPWAAEALAALGDDRGVDALLAALRPGHRLFSGGGALYRVMQLPDGPWTERLVEILVEVSALDDATDAAVLARLEIEANRRGVEPPSTIEEWLGRADTPDGEAERVESLRRRQRGTVERHLARLAMLVRQRCGDAGAAAIDAAAARSGLDLSLLAPAPVQPPGPAGAAVDATVPAWALDYERGDADHRGTRFGGQPTWLEEPTWPLTTAGTPMAFWAQIRLPDDDRMAYLFVDHHDGIISSADGTASVFLQPGGRPDGAWTSSTTGPSLPDSSYRDRSYGPPRPWSLAPRVPSLRRFHEPPAWNLGAGPAPDESWNKVGGTPVYLQGDPGLDGHRFLCQFTADHAGHELGDAAQCYLFTDRASGNGILHWDCH